VGVVAEVLVFGWEVGVWRWLGVKEEARAAERRGARKRNAEKNDEKKRTHAAGTIETVRVQRQ
jgi:hypothetical protein